MLIKVKGVKKKRKKERNIKLSDTLDQMHLIDIYSIFHSRMAECTFLSAHRTCSRIDYILVHKS